MNQYQYIAPGARVGVYVGGVLRHEGIVTDTVVAGGQTVISRSKRIGYAKEELMSEFVGDREVVELPPLSNLHPSLVIANARRLLGTPWRLMDANCEHFVYECFGMKPQSPQLQVWAVLGGVAAILLLVSRTG